AAVLNALEAIGAERSAEVARARSDFESAAAKASADANSAADAARASATAAFDAQVRALSDPKDGLALFQERKDDAAWNAAVASRVAEAKRTLFGGPTPDVLIRKALLAEAFPALLQSYSATLAQIATLNDQVAKLSK